MKENLSRYKYPRTYHLEFSHPSSDDKIMKDYSSLQGEDIIVTEKLDGENTTLYSDYAHARSLEVLKGDDRSWVKSIHAQIARDIPSGWRICGENVYAQHSIAYENLESYFYVFSIWTNENICLSWKDTLIWCELLNLKSVPELYRGKFDLSILRNLALELDCNVCEGFVVRPLKQFHYSDFNKLVGKWVRENHVQSSRHWRTQPIVPNVLKER